MLPLALHLGKFSLDDIGGLVVFVLIVLGQLFRKKPAPKQPPGAPPPPRPAPRAPEGGPSQRAPSETLPTHRAPSQDAPAPYRPVPPRAPTERTPRPIAAPTYASRHVAADLAPLPPAPHETSDTTHRVSAAPLPGGASRAFAPRGRALLLGRDLTPRDRVRAGVLWSEVLRPPRSAARARRS